MSGSEPSLIVPGRNLSLDKLASPILLLSSFFMNKLLPFGDLDSLEQQLKLNRMTAFIMEPIHAAPVANMRFVKKPNQTHA